MKKPDWLFLAASRLSRETTEGPRAPCHARARACQNSSSSKTRKKGGRWGRVKNRQKWSFLGEKRPKSVKIDDFGQKVFFFSRFLPSIAPRLKAPCPSGSRPPIYTVLNAAFSALNTLSGGTVVGHHSPAASHSLPEHSPPEFLASQASPQDDASRISPTTFFFII